MKDNELFESLQYLDDEILTEDVPAAAPKRTWVRWGAAAACLVIAVGAFALLHKPAPEPTPVGGDRPIVPVGVPDPEVGAGDRPIVPGGVPGTPEVPGGYNTGMTPGDSFGMDTPAPDVLAWNELDPASSRQVDNAWMMYGEPLTSAQLAECLPEIRLEWMECTEGYALYWGWGELAYVQFDIVDRERGWQVKTCIIPEGAVRAPDCVFEPQPEEKEAYINDLAYRAYRLYYGDAEHGGERVWLQAQFEKEGVEYALSIDVPAEDELYASLDLRDVLLCYQGTHYVPDFSAYHSGEHVLIDEQPSLTEARSDPDFGAYLPSDVPAGFIEDFIRRYKFDDTADYLMVTWYEPQGNGYIDWLASAVTEEALTRLVSPGETEKYDLSLYPVPWASSVPQTLRTTVEDPVFRIDELTAEVVAARVHAGDEGLTMINFSVLYPGDVLVRVHTKGAEPEWLLEALKSIG